MPISIVITLQLKLYSGKCHKHAMQWWASYDKQKLQIGQKIKPVGGGVASEQARDGVKDPWKGTVY